MTVLSTKNNKQTPLLTFFPRFIFFIFISQTIVYFIHNSPQISQTIQFTITNNVAFIYQLFIEPVIVETNTLKHIGTQRFLIVDNECTGLMLIASVSSTIMAFNHSWPAKIKMLVVAVVVLYFQNITRICHLLFEIKAKNNDFDLYHLYIWQATNLITALLLIFAIERFFGDKKY